MIISLNNNKIKHIFPKNYNNNNNNNNTINYKQNI